MSWLLIQGELGHGRLHYNQYSVPDSLESGLPTMSIGPVYQQCEVASAAEGWGRLFCGNPHIKKHTLRETPRFATEKSSGSWPRWLRMRLSAASRVVLPHDAQLIAILRVIAWNLGREPDR